MLDLAAAKERLSRAYEFYLAGDLEASDTICSALIADAPDEFDAVHLSGVVRWRLGKFRDAVEILERALARRPDDPNLLADLGLAVEAAGDAERALSCFERALALAPAHRHARINLGATLRRLGRARESLAEYDRLLAEAPDDSQALNGRGLALVALGLFVEALATFDRALALAPGSADALNNRGNALRGQLRLEEALASFDAALASDPRLAEAHCNRAAVLGGLGRADEAFAAYAKALELGQDEVESALGRGAVLRNLDRPLDALEMFDRAVASDPRNPDAHASRGVALNDLGRLDEATEAFEAAIALAPRTGRHYLDLAGARRLTTGDPRLAEMRRLAADESLGISDQVHLGYALGKSLLDNGLAGEAFPHFERAARMRRSQVFYDEAAEMAAFARARAAPDAQTLAALAGAGDPSERPVFVFGVPRSGTTLIEQILASHPDVQGAGETVWFERVLRVSPEAGAAARLLGAAYVEKMSAIAPAAPRVVDKTLNNFLYLGLIRLALPSARLIHVSRDPLDACVSCWSTYFASNVNFSYDFGELGRYYRAYADLMEHWRERLGPGALLEVRYEHVVDDAEREARRIVSYCGLPWRAACLDFTQAKGGVRTASYAQVRQPIYKKSVGRWKAWADRLGPLREALEPPASSTNRDRDCPLSHSPPESLRP